MVWAGFVAPALWTALVWSTLGLVNPVLNQRIEWPWFVASQVAFGLAAGWVIARTDRWRPCRRGRGGPHGHREPGVFDEEDREAGGWWRGLLANFAVLLGVGSTAYPAAPYGRTAPSCRPRCEPSTTSTGRTAPGCHGARRTSGRGTAVNDPLYLALIDDSSLRSRLSPSASRARPCRDLPAEGGRLPHRRAGRCSRSARRAGGGVCPEQFKGVALPAYRGGDGDPTRRP